MRLAPGATLGPYAILGPIGAGGMGEVYRARHTALDRLVAIKVLPAALAADPDARARFEREARAVAALSHSNILAIHDFAVDGTTAYVVMELLEGGTLRERLAEGTLPVKKAAQIAREIALGLAAAHDAGFIHRDIKPENIFISSAGQVKILDFGLARPIHLTAADDPNSPTFIRKTDPGTVMGTLGYMSPEQVKGVPADHRSDIFSLGCVLFEMIGGHRPFERATAAETMTAVLREDPVELTKADGALPPAVDQIVRHCLEKEPAERFQSARDLSFALQSATGATSGRQAVPMAVRTRPRWIPVAASTAVLAAVAAAAFLAGRSRTGTPASGPQVVSFRQLTDRAGVESFPALSPDGKTLVYGSSTGGRYDLYSLRIGGRSSVRLIADSTSDDIQPAFSPEGERIAFRSTRDGGGIFVMNASGESIRRLTDYGYSPSWSPDGRELALSPTSAVYPMDHGGDIGQGLFAVDVATVRKRTIAAKADAFQPSWSPHGARIAYWGLRGLSGQRDIYTIAADGSESDRGGTNVTQDPALDWSPTWSPNGQYLYFSSDRGGTMNLWRVRIDETTGRVLSSPEPVTTPSTWCGTPSFSRDGSRMAFASLDWRTTLLKVGFDPVREAFTSAPVPILKSMRPIRDHELSPDGQWVAYTESSPQEDLLVARTDGKEYRRLTDDGFRDRGPTWSPDGQRISFYSDRSGTYEAWVIRPDGSGLERVTDFGNANFATWSPDGRQLAFSGVSLNGTYIIDAASRSLKKPARTIDNLNGRSLWPFSWSATHGLAGTIFNADGVLTRLAVYSIQSHQLREVPDSVVANWQVPAWVGDSARVLVRDPAGLAIVDTETGARRRLLNVGGYAIGRGSGISRDGRWITYAETGIEGDIWLATFAGK